jgi:hypothetical protein
VVFFTPLSTPLDTGLDPNALAITRVATGGDTGLDAAFWIHFADFAGATFASEGHFEPDFAHGITIFMESNFLFPGAFTRLTDVFPTSSIFRFLEASVNASVP